MEAVVHRTYAREYAESRIPLSPEDYAFGLDHGLLPESYTKLQHLFPLKGISAADWGTSHEVWRFVALSWALEHCTGDQDLFDEVNWIWADFDSPPDMVHLISFMPTDDPNASPARLRSAIGAFHAGKERELAAVRGNARGLTQSR